MDIYSILSQQEKLFYLRSDNCDIIVLRFIQRPLFASLLLAVKGLLIIKHAGRGYFVHKFYLVKGGFTSGGRKEISPGFCF